MGVTQQQQQQLQQHMQVSRKRSSEQGENGCPEKSKKPKEKTEATKADLEDGANMSIQVEQVTLLSQQHIPTGTQKDRPCCIQSLLRRDRHVRSGEPYGNLLKAGSERSLETINVDFTGTDTKDKATEFHMEMSHHDKQAYALRYSEEKDNYYLKVKKSGGVNLRKLVNFPTDDKYFFRINHIDSEVVTIQSLKTKGLYLHCSDLGEVFMKEVTTEANEEPKDRQTWFKFLRKEHVVQYQKMSMTFAENDSGIKCKIVQETVDVKDSGKASPTDAEEGNSEDAQKEDAENPQGGNSEVPEEDNCNDPGSGTSEDAAQATPEAQKEEHSGEL